MTDEKLSREICRYIGIDKHNPMLKGILALPSVKELVAKAQKYDEMPDCSMCKYIGDKTFEDLDAANNKLEALTEDYGDALWKIEGLEQTLKSIWMYSTGDDHQWRRAILKKVEEALNQKGKE